MTDSRNNNSDYAKAINTNIISDNEENTEDDDRKERKQTKNKSSKMKRKWFVLVAGFVLIFMSVGVPFQLSVLYVEILEEFGSSNAETALVQSVCTGVLYGGGFLSGLIVTRFGVRISGSLGGVIAAAGLTSSFVAMNVSYLAVSVGLISGFGFSLAYVCSSTGVGQHFHGKSKILALSFVSFGSGVGSMSFPYIIENLIQMYGWRGTLLVIGGMSLNFIPASLLCVPPKIKKSKLKEVRKSAVWISKQNDQSPGISQNSQTVKRDMQIQEQNNFSSKDKNSEIQRKNNKEIAKGLKIVLKNKLFLLYVVGVTMAMSALNSLLIFIIDFYQSLGLDKANAVFVLFIFNAVGACSRFIPGLLKQIPHMSVMVMPVMYSLLGCVVIPMFTKVNAYGDILFISCLYGISLGGMVTILSVTTVKLVGVEHYSTAFGILLSISSIGLISAGPVSGKLRDISGSYDLSFYTACGSLGCATVIFILAALLRKRTRKEEITLAMEIIVKGQMPRRRSSILPWKRSVDFVY